MSLRLDPDPRAHPGPGVVNLATDPFSFDDEPAPAAWPPPDDATPVLRVTAVLVAHDGAAFLPRTLDAIEAQTRRPDHLIAVDAGSVDGGGDLLGLATGRVLRLSRSTSFGDAVQAAVTALDGNALDPAPDPRPAGRHDGAAGADPAPGARPGSPGVEWLWLLHDDSAPSPQALERLIEAVDGGPSIGIAGCKQVSWDDGRRLLDVGFTTSRLGARVTGIDVDDVDQGQLDHRSDVMAVGTAGMLVRRDVWDTLGGPDPALAHARDDLDLCRRAHLAGLRVVVVPAAVIAHATATATGRRVTTGLRSGGSWALRDRRAAVHLRLASVPLLLLPLLVLWLAAAALARALVRLGLKQPQRAASELAAFALAMARPLPWLRARRRVRAHRRLPRRDFRRLLAGPGAALRQRRDSLSSYLRSTELAWATPAPGRAGVAESAAGQSLSIQFGPTGLGEPDDSDDVPFADERIRPARRPVTRIGLLVALSAGIAGLAGLRLLLSGSGTPLGPALIPAPARAADLWSAALSGWRPTGLGRPGVADPFDAVLALLAWPLGGSPAAAAEVLLIGALPLAALLAWWAAGGVTRSRALRAWAAIGWAAAPSLLTAVAAGRLAAIVAHLVLPPTALALARAVGARPDPAPGEQVFAAALSGRGRSSVSAASGAGLLITVLIAASPALAVPALLAVLVTAGLCRFGRGLLAWVLAVPAVLLLPWWTAVAGQPRLLLAEPGGASATGPRPAGWVAALWPLDPAGPQPGPVPRLARFAADLTSLGDATLWLRVVAIGLSVPLIGLGLSALLRRDRGRLAGGFWIAGLAGLAVAALAPVLDTRSDSGAELHGWPGAGVSLLILGVLGAALVRLDGGAGRLRARSVGVRHWLAVGAGIVAVLAPVLVLAGWAVNGWSGSPSQWVHRGSPDAVPAVAAAEADGPGATRTLALKVSGQRVRWALYRAGGPRIGQDSAVSLAAVTSPAATDPVTTAIGGLLSDAGTDQRGRLADLDVGSVLLLGPADDAATVALDTAPGLIRVATPNGGVLWRVELDGGDDAPTRPARARVVGPTGATVATLPSRGSQVRARLAAGAAGRTLVLAERADPGWKAWLDGRRLTPVEHAGWDQAFALPAAGGVLVVHPPAGAGRTVDGVRLGTLGLALLMAIPLPRRRPRLLPPPQAQRPAPLPVPVETGGRRVRAQPVPEPRSEPDPRPEPPEPARPESAVGPLIPPIWDVSAEPGSPVAEPPVSEPVEADDEPADVVGEPYGIDPGAGFLPAPDLNPDLTSDLTPGSERERP